jgi:PAS domain S-box-containing protein
MENNANRPGSKKRIANTRHVRNGNGSRNNSQPASLSARELAREQAIQRYVELYDFAPTGYVSFDRSGRIAEINLAAARLFGLHRESLIGMPFAVLVWREDTPIFLHHLLRCRSKENRVDTELRLKDKNREIIYAELCSMPTSASEQDGAVLFQTSIVDLTTRKKAEAAIQEKEEELERIITQTPFMLARCARDLRYRYVSQAYADMFGYKPEQFLGKSIVATIGAKALATIRPYIDRVLAGETVTYETIIPYKEIGPHFLGVTYVPDKNERGEVIGWIASMTDIGERRKADERFRVAVEASPSGMVLLDQDRKITLVNSEAERLFGYERNQMVGKSVELLMPERFSGQIRIVSEPRILGADGKLFALRKDGTEMPVEVRLGPVRMEKKWFVLASILDITQRKKAQEKIAEAARLLEQRVRKRTHELHLTNKRLQSEIERRKGLEGEILSVSDREQQRLGQELHDGLCQHLTAVAFMTRSIALRLRNHRVVDADDIEKVAELVNKAAVDTRNLSRALHRVDVDAAGLLVALQDLVDREIWRTPCRLEVKPSFRIDDDATAAHLYRIAREAVINANKHAQARQIVVRLERVRKDMVLRVIDDGIGLPGKLKPQQGLGFHIMNYRAQLMGGRVEIDSPQTGGTRVSCYLSPRAAESNKAANADRRNRAMPTIQRSQSLAI